MSDHHHQPPELTRDVVASGVRLRVDQWQPVGNAASTPVMLLHDLLADRRTWTPLASMLTGAIPTGIESNERRASDNFRVLAADLPGFGESEKPNPGRYLYGIEAFAEAVADLFGALDIGRAHLVGHGLGGGVALRVAANHPELVSRLILIDSLCYPASLDPRLRWARMPLLGGLMLKQMLGRSAYRALYRDRVSESADLERIDAYYDGLNTPAGRGALLATLRATVDTRVIVADSRRIQIPTLVMWGRDDRMLPASYGRRLAREIRHAGFELLDAGHAPHEEFPGRVSQIVREFLIGQRAGVR